MWLIEHPISKDDISFMLGFFSRSGNAWLFLQQIHRKISLSLQQTSSVKCKYIIYRSTVSWLCIQILYVSSPISYHDWLIKFFSKVSNILGRDWYEMGPYITAQYDTCQYWIIGQVEMIPNTKSSSATKPYIYTQAMLIFDHLTFSS